MLLTANRRFSHCFSALLVAMAVQTVTAAASAQLRIEDAVRLALANNERARIANLRVVDAGGSLDRARAAFMPSLVAGASTTQHLHADKSGASRSSSGTLTLTQPIFAPSAGTSRSSSQTVPGRGTPSARASGTFGPGAVRRLPRSG